MNGPEANAAATSPAVVPFRLAVIGDSFSEGLGDGPDEQPIGWPDLVATQLAAERTVDYVNLAIRGKLLRPIATEQVDTVLALDPLPTLVTVNGGGNDLLRPGSDPAELAELLASAVDRLLGAGLGVMLLSGPNPGRHLPLGGRFDRLGGALTRIVSALSAENELPFVDNFSDTELMRRVYWAPDRLHLGPAGHRRVAARVLGVLGSTAPELWSRPLADADVPFTRAENARFYVDHVGPWVGRRLRRRSSGDARAPKYPTWQRVSPAII